MEKVNSWNLGYPTGQADSNAQAVDAAFQISGSAHVASASPTCSLVKRVGIDALVFGTTPSLGDTFVKRHSRSLEPLLGTGWNECLQSIPDFGRHGRICQLGLPIDCRSYSIVMKASLRQRRGNDGPDPPILCERVLQRMLDRAARTSDGDEKNEHPHPECLADIVAPTTALNAWSKSGHADASSAARVVQLWCKILQLYDHRVWDVMPNNTVSCTISYSSRGFLLLSTAATISNLPMRFWRPCTTLPRFFPRRSALLLLEPRHSFATKLDQTYQRITR